MDQYGPSGKNDPLPDPEATGAGVPATPGVPEETPYPAPGYDASSAEPASSSSPVAPPASHRVMPPPLPGSSTDRNAVPVVAAPKTGPSLLAMGCMMTVVSLLVSALAGAGAGWLAAHAYRTGTLEPTSGASPISVSATDEPVAAAAGAALPSVVNIDVRSRASTSTGGSDGLPEGHPDVPQGGTGSGVAFRLTADGGTYILTNNHVVENADSIAVTYGDGKKLRGTLVGRDPETDIAVVKVPGKLPIIRLGDSEQLVVGQMVVAIGSPFGLQHSVSSGIVSAVHRALPGVVSNDGSRTSPLVDVVQTDAAINPGNSGGALVDRAGRLVGINSAIYSDTGQNSGIGFAIPVQTAIRVGNELISGGTARHPFLGVEGMTVDETLAKERKLPVSEGAVIEAVIAGTGAERAGLKKGDIVVALDGQPVRTMDDLILRVRRTKVGDRVQLTVWRDGQRITVPMVVGDKPAKLK